VALVLALVPVPPDPPVAPPTCPDEHAAAAAIANPKAKAQRMRGGYRRAPAR
jgi:hypothetical protein